MLGYVTVGVNDMDRAKGFYDEVLKPLGARQMMPLDNGVIYGVRHLALGIVSPVDGAPATAGNGSMTGLVAPTKHAIHAAYAKALELGGVDEGAPGPRGSKGFYAAYFRDLDGNKICLFRMETPETPSTLQ